MTAKDRAQLRYGLTEAIERYLDTASEDVTLPYQGENTAEIMARAALTVLEGMEDAEAYLRRGGMLAE